MLKIFFCTAVISLCNVLGCHKVMEEPEPMLIDYQLCGSQKIADTPIQVCFLELMEESRCPASVVCVWAGVAKVKLGVTIGPQTHTLQLSTLLSPSQQYFTDTTVSGFHFKLLEVSPYPGTVNSPKRVTVSVTH